MGQLADEVLDAVESRLGFHFRNRALLEQALTHKSYPNAEQQDWPAQGTGRTASNERLEFLGDAVLGTVVTTHLYMTHPEWSEGELTKVKAAAVSERALGRIGRRLGLGEFLLLGKGEEQSGGRERPAMLADTVEALIGAVFLDVSEGRFDAYPCGRWVLEILGPAMQDIERDEHGKDYKTILQEMSQETAGILPTYQVVDESGPDHHKTFVVEVRLAERIVGVGKGHSKKEAEQNAAREALEDPQWTASQDDASDENDAP